MHWLIILTSSELLQYINSATEVTFSICKRVLRAHSYEHFHCVCNKESTDLSHINDSFLINSFIGETE